MSWVLAKRGQQKNGPGGSFFTPLEPAEQDQGVQRFIVRAGCRYTLQVQDAHEATRLSGSRIILSLIDSETQEVAEVSMTQDQRACTEASFHFGQLRTYQGNERAPKGCAPSPSQELACIMGPSGELEAVLTFNISSFKGGKKWFWLRLIHAETNRVITHPRIEIYVRARWFGAEKKQRVAGQDENGSSARDLIDPTGLVRMATSAGPARGAGKRKSVGAGRKRGAEVFSSASDEDEGPAPSFHPPAPPPGEMPQPLGRAGGARKGRPSRAAAQAGLAAAVAAVAAADDDEEVMKRGSARPGRGSLQASQHAHAQAQAHAHAQAQAHAHAQAQAHAQQAQAMGFAGPGIVGAQYFKQAGPAGAAPGFMLGPMGQPMPPNPFVPPVMGFQPGMHPTDGPGGPAHGPGMHAGPPSYFYFPYEGRQGGGMAGFGGIFEGHAGQQQDLAMQQALSAQQRALAAAGAGPEPAPLPPHPPRKLKKESPTGAKGRPKQRGQRAAPAPIDPSAPPQHSDSHLAPQHQLALVPAGDGGPQRRPAHRPSGSRAAAQAAQAGGRGAPAWATGEAVAAGPDLPDREEVVNEYLSYWAERAAADAAASDAPRHAAAPRHSAAPAVAAGPGAGAGPLEG
eukprot:tig00001071_g6800.t1